MMLQEYGSKFNIVIIRRNFDRETLAYLSGFADGEGCFSVTFNRSKRHKFGWDIRPSFSISQNSDRAEVLNLFLEVFGCGTIRPDRSDRTLKFEIRSVEQLVRIVIPHFRVFPLRSSKQNEFLIFAEICELMVKKNHLNKNGFDGIRQKAAYLNMYAKKKYSRFEIKI